MYIFWEQLQRKLMHIWSCDENMTMNLFLGVIMVLSVFKHGMGIPHICVAYISEVFFQAIHACPSDAATLYLKHRVKVEPMFDVQVHI